MGAGWLPDPRPVHSYLERDTSTTLRIKAAKAHIAPTAMHTSAKDIRVFLLLADRPAGHHDSRRRRLELCKTENVPQLQILNMQN